MAVLHSSSKVLISKRCQFLHPFCGGDSEIVCLVGVARKAFFKFFVLRAFDLRLQPAQDVRKQNEQYKMKGVYQSAAKLWAEGVPFKTALQLARDASKKADRTSMEGQAVRGKGRGKGKAKARGR